MRIITKAEYIWNDNLARYVLVHEDSFEHAGPVGLCKGASAQQTSLAASQTSFYNTMTADYSQQFANQTAILGALTNSLQPVLSAGPNQFGFGTAETNSLNSSAIQGTGQQYQNAQRTLQQNQAAAGGGNSVVPSGANAQQQAALAASGANQTSSELLGIQQAGYQQGHQNYESAVSSLEGEAGLENPTGYAGAATSAGSSAASEANTISQENNAASPWPIIGGVLGGVANTLTGGLTSGLMTPPSGNAYQTLYNAGQPSGLSTGAASGTDGA